MFEKDIDIDYGVIIKNKVPILTMDSNWKTIFGNSNNKDINNYKNILNDLIKEQRELSRKLVQLKTKKKRLMAMILNLSNEINNRNNSKAVEKLDECQREIHSINEEIETYTFKLEMLPKEIRAANLSLLKATIKVAYKDIKSNQEELDSICSQIEELRGKLKNLIEAKHEKEEIINKTYSFLHGILGSKEMERLDNELL
ncbi:hypothetical protein [Caloranaerobacter azorensis]|uniref:Uncharacterized protein n=2 Tax=Caloranaerobacter azorensis TaxID=116090 RepID=A0A096DMP3_9FIRM|nr:hypothetical protein [Caloranaerobacter azorensis]KGG80526.1 hypothetical protein Y919_05675 [Caloranaerobacter azorensis H53214]QIB26949.1 hypothetical protein G3A45_06375 [Caloranaerobacter azorensis]